jgi:cytochrome b561
MLPRLVLRVAGRTPETDAQGWLAAAAKAGHAVLYLF